MIRRNSTQEKILLLLFGGLALSLTRSPKRYFKVLKQIHKEWQKIDRRNLMNAIKSLYKSKLIKQSTNKKGITTFILTKEGQKVALKYNLDTMTIPVQKWDGKWRIVMSDIPERIKKVREAMRYHLKRLGFIELQHSVFVYPFECQNEIEYIIEFYNIRRFVRYLKVYYIDNELDLRHKFKIL